MRRAALVSALLLVAAAASAADFQYVLTRRDHGTISGNVNVDVIKGMKDRWPGEFLWVQRNGVEYVIRDADTIAEARAAFSDVRALQPEYASVRLRLRPIEQRHAALERELTRLGVELSRMAEPDRRSHERRMVELQLRMRPLENEMQLLEREELRIERREEQLVEIAEAKLKEIVDRVIRVGTAERLR